MLAAAGASDATARGQASPRCPQQHRSTPQRWLGLGLQGPGCVFPRKTTRKSNHRAKLQKGQCLTQVIPSQTTAQEPAATDELNYSHPLGVTGRFRESLPRSKPSLAASHLAHRDSLGAAGFASGFGNSSRAAICRAASSHLVPSSAASGGARGGGKEPGSTHGLGMSGVPVCCGADPRAAGLMVHPEAWHRPRATCLLRSQDTASLFFLRSPLSLLLSRLNKPSSLSLSL